MNRNEPIQILVSRGPWAGVGRGVFLFPLHHERNFDRIVFTVLFLPGISLKIFLFFLSSPSSSCMGIHDDACSSLFLFNVIIIIFLTRQVHPSSWRRRLRKSVRPLPAVPVGMNLMTRNQSLLIAINRRIPSTSYSAHKSSFLRV